MRTSSLASRLALLAAATVAVTAAASPAQALPAFPGAEGFGAVATGGRGGQVIKVTTLNATGPGSLQAALDQPGPRIIVFDVSGVIHGDITVTHGDVTIAGQTAPGAGITIEGRLYGEYDDGVSNAIIRFLRVRPIYDGSAGEQFDGMQFSLNSKLIFDHVSVSWGVDETFDLYEADDVTVQWSTIEESGTVGHPEGQHNYGLINGPDGHRIAVHHNLFIHHRNRNPAIANGPAEVRNNVAYNVRNGFVHHNPASGKFNIVGNSYIEGPSAEIFPFYFDDAAGPGLSYYLADNAIDDPGDYVGVVDNPWQEPLLHSSFADIGRDESYRSPVEHDFTQTVPGYVPVTTQPSDVARDLVLEKAGAFPRDVVTRRVVDELGARGGSWGAHVPDDLMEGLTPGSPPPDADGDGMPDAWETAHGLDPADDGDATTVTASGYTAIEDYINGVADDRLGGGAGGGSSSSSSGSSGGGSDTTTSGGGSTSTGTSSGGGPGAGAGGAGAIAGAGGADASLANPDGSTGNGCSCELRPVGGFTSGGLLAAALALVLARRRRRA